MLHVHRAERADALAAALADLLSAPPADPFAPEVVAVPSRGMERWIAQRLSTRLGASPGRADGACANVRFPFPVVLAREAVAAASGVAPEEDPWAPERSVWPLLEVVDDALGEDWLALLGDHLRDTPERPRPGRRLQTAGRLAALFDRYALHRPETVRAWLTGDDGDLPPDARWQPELLRRLAARIEAPNPAERVESATVALENDPRVVDLPERVSLFGLTRLPAGHLAILRALAAHRDVHLFLLHPSPGLWERIKPLVPKAPPRRADDPTATLAHNRLLASWGSDAREMQLVLGPEPTDHHHAIPAPPPTLLGRLQAAVRADEKPRPATATDDRSIEIHSCHGRARQVEVLRDTVLRLLQEDQRLEPRDIVVMCPDIETFAPLIHATFGVGDVAEDEELGLTEDLRPPDLRVRLADRALRQTNPVLGALSALLELADGRVAASTVLDLADREPVRRRFGLSDDDLARLRDWVAESGIRWGLTPEQRAPYKLAGASAGTWQLGLDRILLGATMAGDDPRLFGATLPLDDVDSGAIVLAGRLAELTERLRTLVEAASTPRPVAAWTELLAETTDALTAVPERSAWQPAELARILDAVAEEAGASETAVTLAEIRALLADRLRGRPTRANFRTGQLTICTLVPMRSVPHRVVCLLGIDDGAFPRKAPRDGDDLMLADPAVGERDPRTEDRQLFLDALLAAEEKLVVTYAGRDERTNATRPGAVPVAELLDAIETAAPGARERVLVEHPLQPIDRRNFLPGELVPGAPFAFDPVNLEGAERADGPRRAAQPFLVHPLPALDEPDVALDDLVRFVEHPVRAFLRQRLGLSLYERDDEVEDELPLALTPLERFGVGDRLVRAVLAGADREDAIRAEWSRGALPPRALGQRELRDEIIGGVDTIVRVARERLGAETPGSREARVALPGGTIVAGTVQGIVGTTTRFVTYARLAPKHRLASWVRLLVLSAAHPEREWDAYAIGRGEGKGVLVAHIPPLAPDPETRAALAREALAALVDLRAEGMREPLPLFSKTSAAYAQAVRDGRDGPALARREWASKFDRDKEDRDPEHVLCFGPEAELDALLEMSRFAELAHRLWDPLLLVEER